jgi:hypothetical protein
MSRKEFCALHGIKSLNTYTAMLKRGDGPREMILGSDPHSPHRISFAENERWTAWRQTVVISEEARAADREKRAKAHAAKKPEDVS